MSGRFSANGKRNQKYNTPGTRSNNKINKTMNENPVKHNTINMLHLSIKLPW